MKTFLKFLAAAIFLGILVSACTGTSFQPVDKEYVLTTDLREGRLVFLGVSDEINGLENPTLSARPGSTITVTLINGGEGQHNLTFPEVQASTAVLTEKGEEASVTFTVPNTHGEMEYYDDVANHAELGMRGKLMVSETDQPMPVAAEQSNGDPQVLAAFQKGACGSCHAIDGIPNAVGVIAPNLSDINTAAEEHLKSDAYTGTATTTEEYIRESIADPNLFVAPTCPTGACAPNVMPATLKDALTEEEINSIVNYLSGLPEGAYSTSTEAAAAPQAPTTGVDVVRDPTDLPAPLAVREPQTVRVDLETIEVEGQLADGTTFTYWTFNGAVPGPFIRVRVGDTSKST